MLVKNSKKQIVKNMSIIGGSSFFAILIGLVKVKVLSVLLGPAGIGLMGLLMSIMAVGSTLFGMGVSASGVRQIALNEKNVENLEIVRKTLFYVNCLLGLFAFIVIFFLKETLSIYFFKNSDYQLAIIIIGLGVFFTLISGSQTALLQGFRRISELAKVNMFAALVASAIGLLSVWIFGEASVPFFIITVPLFTCVVALFYCKKLPKLTNLSISLKQLSIQWQSMFNLGFSFMLIAMIGVSSQLIVRNIITQELNVESVGYFQAAWQISMTYIAFVLGAMAADYYPRLTQQIHNKNEANRLVNEQAELTIIFSAPILLAMLAFAPFIINLLYSSDFNGSVEILRWQVFGDVLKILSWPIAFIIAAQGRSQLCFLTELLWGSSYILFVYLGIECYGVQITGYAFVFSYLIYLFAVYLIGWIVNDFKWTGKNIKLIMGLICASASLLILSYFSLASTLILGVFFVICSTVYALNMLATLNINNHMINKILKVYSKFENALKFKY